MINLPVYRNFNTGNNDNDPYKKVVMVIQIMSIVTFLIIGVVIYIETH